jgi:membrane protein YdbS with pleckstrin-like domain
MEAKFSSKIDGWLIPVMVLAVGGLLAALVAVFVQETPWPIRLLVAAVTAAVTLLLLAVFKSTYYLVRSDDIRIVSGPFRWEVPLADIRDIAPTRNPLSSPALSMDRLKISYGKRKFVLISPDDKDGFLRAVAKARQQADV